MREEGSAPLRLLELCATCVDLGVPMEHVSPGLAVLKLVSERFGFSTLAVGADLPELAAYQRELGEENARKMRAASELVAGLHGSGKVPVLVGDLATMIEVFGSVAAFPARVITVGVPGEGSGESSVTRRLASPVPSDLSVAPLGRLQRVVGSYSRLAQLEGWTFRVPTGAALVALLAARLGDPMANPVSATWLQLGVTLKAGRDRLDLHKVLELAVELGVREEVHRGLAIVASIFPELRSRIPSSKLVLSAMERRVAVPVAAHKLVAYSLGEEL